MSIYRPRESASWCEERATHYARLASSAPGNMARIWKAQESMYLQMRQRLILRHGIKCCSVSLHHRAEGQS